MTVALFQQLKSVPGTVIISRQLIEFTEDDPLDQIKEEVAGDCLLEFVYVSL